MARRTATSIIAAGLQLAGDTSLTTHAQGWLNDGLRSLYKDWPWPFLMKRKTGLALAQGASSAAFGAGSGGESLDVSRIYDPIWVTTSDYQTKARARVMMYPPTAIQDAGIDDPSNNSGRPDAFRVTPDQTVPGKFNLLGSKVADKAYLLNFDYLYVPADITDFTSSPLYPQDETLVQFIMAMAMVHMAAPEEKAQMLASMLGPGSVFRTLAMQDKMRYGSSEGVNEDQVLDPEVFR